MMFAATDEQKRLTITPHLVVEALSSDPDRGIIREARKHAAAGAQRYWIIDPDGPEITVYGLADSMFVERVVCGPDTEATLDAGPVQVTFEAAPHTERLT